MNTWLANAIKDTKICAEWEAFKMLSPEAQDAQVDSRICSLLRDHPEQLDRVGRILSCGLIGFEVRSRLSQIFDFHRRGLTPS